MISILKRCLAIFLCVALTALPAITACATGDYSWAETEIQYCKKNNIMTGDENGNLNPGGTLTRAEMAKMLVESFDIVMPDGTSNSWVFDDFDTV